MSVPDTTPARRPRNHPVWLGLLLTAVGLVSYFTVFYRFPVLRDVPWINVPLVLAGVALSLWGVWRRRSLLSVAGVVLSAAMAGLLLWYVLVLSAGLPGTDTAVAVGATAPGFSLAGTDGRVLDSADLADRSLLVVFYRGFW